MKQDITRGLGVSRTQTKHLSLKNAAFHVCLNLPQDFYNKILKSICNRKMILGQNMLTFHIGWTVDSRFSQQQNMKNAAFWVMTPQLLLHYLEWLCL